MNPDQALVAADQNLKKYSAEKKLWSKFAIYLNTFIQNPLKDIVSSKKANPPSTENSRLFKTLFVFFVIPYLDHGPNAAL